MGVLVYRVEDGTLQSLKVGKQERGYQAAIVHSYLGCKFADS